jgi:hypothetical protein
MRSRTIRPPGNVGILVGGWIKYVAKPGYVAPTALALRESRGAGEEAATREKQGGAHRSDVPCAAGELCDRCIERANNGLLIEPSGKYDVSRILSAVEGARAMANADATPTLHVATSKPAPLLKAS